jgi:hypothetical protein
VDSTGSYLEMIKGSEEKINNSKFIIVPSRVKSIFGTANSFRKVNLGSTLLNNLPSVNRTIGEDYFKDYSEVIKLDRQYSYQSISDLKEYFEKELLELRFKNLF